MSEECDTGEGDYSDPASTDTAADGCLGCAIVDGWACNVTEGEGESECHALCGDGFVIPDVE